MLINIPPHISSRCYRIKNLFLLIALLFFCHDRVHGQRIAFLTDVHVGPGLDSEAGLQKIVEEINTGLFDFAIVTGDLTNTGTDAELNAVHSILKSLQIPFYAIPGNHETNWSESACQTFNRLFGDDKIYFEYGDYRFIGYSTGPYLKMGDGNIRREDLGWITQTLKRSPEKTLISLSHYPLADGLDNWNEITTLLREHSARAALCGHGHRLSLHNFNGIPGIMGRSSLARGNTPIGYNIIELQQDSMLVYAKNLNEAPELFIRFSLKNNAVLKDVPSTPEVSYALNNLYPDAAPVYQYADTASIFTGAVPLSSSVAVYGTSTGDLIARNIRSGKVIWRKKFPGSIYGTPILAGDILVVGSIDGKITGVRARNGKTVWTVQTNGPVIADGIAEDNMVYIGAGNTTFYKINAANGKIVWQFDGINGQMQGRPALSSGEVVFGAWDRHLYCLDKQRGELKWKWNNGRPHTLYSPGNVAPAISGKRVFIVATDRYMTAIDLNTGQTLWRNNAHTVREAMTISEDGSAIYAKLMNDSIIAVSAKADSFQLLWAVHAGFGYEHNPCPLLALNGYVYAGTKNGELAVVDTRTGSLAWRRKPGNSAVNKILADPEGNIWISLIEGKIFQYKQQHTPN